MTLPKPLEVEKGELTGPPPSHDPLDIGALLERSVMPTPRGVRIAGTEVLMTEGDPVLWAAQLRLTLRERFLERHPMADEEVWQAFLTRARGVIDLEQVNDDELGEMLLRVIDEL